MKIGWLWPAMAAVAALALACACGSGGSRTAQASTPSQALAEAETSLAPSGVTLGGQRSGNLLVWLASKPEQPVEGTARMEVYLVGTDGQLVTNARVGFDTDMTNMSHGLYLVTAEPAGGGYYVGDVHYSMPGPWRVIAVVEREGQETVRSRFEFKVK